MTAARYRGVVRTALIIQTDHDGPAGLAADHLRQRGFTLHVVEVLGPEATHSDVLFPDPTGFDLVLPLGSVHSVYDTERIGSWVQREIDCLRRAHQAGVPVFGICFGAQVLCTALGGTVERSPVYELGWIELDSDDPSRVPPGPWLSWHGDRCLLSDDVVELARTQVATQAFAAGASMGVQFHPEVTERIVTDWIASCPPAFFTEAGVDPEAVRNGFARHGELAARNFGAMLDRHLDEHLR